MKRNTKTNNKNQFIVFSNNNGKYNVPLLQITRFDANREYTIAHTTDGKHHWICGHLGKLSRKLKKTRLFIRIHRSFLINTQFIKGWFKSRKRIYFTMLDEVSLAIARRRTTRFIKFIKKHKFFTI